MTWEIRRTVTHGETVALDIVENGELVAGVTIRGDIAKAERRAALIAAAPELLKFLKANRREHDVVDDCWYSCPKSGECCNDMADPTECLCGADDYNALVDDLIAKAKGE